MLILKIPSLIKIYFVIKTFNFYYLENLAEKNVMNNCIL